PAGRTREHRRREGAAVLVDGEGVAGVLDRRMQADVVIRVLVAVDRLGGLADEPRRAQRAYRVPHADELDRRTRPTVPNLAERCLPLGRPRPLAVLVAGVNFRNEIVVVLLDQADFVHEADERAYRERAAAEPEEVELVPRLVVVDDEPVQRADVVLDAGAERAARHFVDGSAGADAVPVEHDLIDAVPIAGANGARDLGHVRRPALAGFLVELVADVPGAVRADDDAFHARPRTPGAPVPLKSP